MDEGGRKAVIATDSERILMLYENRDEQALRETAAQYGAICRSLARNITGSEEDAEECLNDALMKVWETVPPEHPESLRAYLLRIVRNAALNRLERQNAQKRGGCQLPAAYEELAECLPAKENVMRQAEQKELFAAVGAFLAKLPQRQRDLFVRRYWFASSEAELGELFGMTENHVRVTLSRIRKRLRNHLRKEGLL